MRALIHLEARRISTLAPAVAIMLIFGLTPAVMGQAQGTSLGMAFLTMTAVVLVSRIFALEEAGARANTLVATLPVTRRQVIGARYVLSLSLIAVASALVALIGQQVDWQVRLGTSAVVATIALLNLAVVGPLSSRGGSTRLGPIVPVLPFALLTLLIVFLPDGWKRQLLSWTAEAPAAGVTVATVALAVIVVASYLLSVRWFVGRDL